MSSSMMLKREIREKYQPVIGLEVHLQLSTRSKIFASENFSFGGEPNTYISAITIAHPGALPRMNELCIRHGVKLGLATHCKINQYCYFDRKNYFYPDLPKGYQVSQDQRPICIEGHLYIDLPDGTRKKIGIDRIHLEEDAGKSIHDLDDHDSMIDLNRSGVGLAELVTKPDLRSSIEAALFLTEIRKLARYLEVCDGNMEQGSLRCDANISVMLKDAKEYGTRVEVKNMNSISNVSKAIEHEIERQILMIESGGSVVQETRTWDPVVMKTFGMRDKETADDYRYFPEPDLQPVHISDELLKEIHAEIPALPQALYQEFRQNYPFNHSEAEALVEEKVTADYFLALIKNGTAPKQAANWVLGPVKAYLNEQGISADNFPVLPPQLSGLIQIISEGKISHDAAKKQVFPFMLEHPAMDAITVATQLNVLMESNEDEVERVMDELIAEFPAEVSRYLKGKKGLAGFFIGKLMAKFKGKADPKKVNVVVQTKLEAARK